MLSDQYLHGLIGGGSGGGGYEINNTFLKDVVLGENLLQGDVIAAKSIIYDIEHPLKMTAPASVLPNNTFGISISADGHYLAISIETTPFLKTYTLNESSLMYEVTNAPSVLPAGAGRGVSMSSDGQFLAISHSTSPYVRTYKWNVGNNRYELLTQPDIIPAGNGIGAALSADGQYLAIAHTSSPCISTYKLNSFRNSIYQNSKC